MEKRTIAIYEAHAGDYARRRPPAHGGRARALAAVAVPGRPVADLGCGPGGYASDLAISGHGVVGVDAAAAMVALAGQRERGVRADLEALPFRYQALGGAWARNAYVHVPAARLPLALAHLHHAMAVGAPLSVSLVDGGDFTSDDDLPGRAFFGWEAEPLGRAMVGAGFVDVAVERTGTGVWGSGCRGRTLPDFVGPGMRLLVCGLNPSVVSADAGYGYARPTNRFWKAALAAGVVTRARDPWRALAVDRVGMTDLVKRATTGAGELSVDEYRAGASRLSWLVGWLRPAAVCFVGLDGWRAAVDRRAGAGWQPAGFAGVPAYLMPSSSGRNARTTVAELVGHLQAALGPRRRS